MHRLNAKFFSVSSHHGCMLLADSVSLLCDMSTEQYSGFRVLDRVGGRFEQWAEVGG